MESPKVILRYIVGLVGVFCLGFLLLGILHFSFLEILDRFNQELENERSRIVIGEVIIANINQIERNFYLLATTSTGSRSVEKIYARTEIFFDQIERAFAVFRNGGTLTATVRLNREGMQDFVRTISYIPPEKEEYLLEIIDLRPKVKEIRERMQTLTYLIAKRNSLIRSAEHVNLEKVRDDILIFMKKTPSHFVRLHENANSLYYQGHKNLERLEGEISRRKAYYTKITSGVMAAIIAVVLAICGHIARQIYAAHSHLDFVSREMEKARKDAETAQKIKADFLATMGHEIRTPMNIIVGMSGLALETTLTSTQHRYLSRIQSAAEILLGLLDNILDFARMDDGKLQFSDQPFDLHEVVSSVTEVVKGEARNKGLEVKASVVNDTSCIPQGDPVRMRQILLILARNAVKFTEKGEVIMQAHLEEIDAQRLQVVVEVRDTGVGIAHEQLATIFETFAQGDGSSTRKYAGTGLGLAISNQLANLMGGEITVESEVGKGSIFILTLPMGRASKAAVSSLDPDITQAPVRSLEILIADGDSDQLEMGQALLSKAGHRVKGAANGLEALRCMARFQYDVVLLALDMSVLAGREVALDIRAFENGEAVERPELGYDIDWLAARLNGHHTLLVAVNTHSTTNAQDARSDSLFDDHIEKPYLKTQVIDLLNRLTGVA